MSELDLPSGSRAFLQEMRALTRDLDGNEILAGLTVPESEWYVAYSESRILDRGPPNAGDRKHYLELHDRHEAARLAIVDAEIEVRWNRPTPN